MAHYDCERCGFSTKYKNNFRSHLNRKFVCPPKLSTISISYLREIHGMQNGVDSNDTYPEKINQMNTNEHSMNTNEHSMNTNEHKMNTNEHNPKLSVLACEYCSKMFKTKPSKRRHELHFCKTKKQKDMIYDKLEDAIIEMTKLREDNEALKKAMTVYGGNSGNSNSGNSNSGNSNSCNSNNSNNNITINNFGKENTEYLQGNLLKQLASKPFMCIPNLVKLTHFNKDHPENHNIRFRNKKHPLGEVYKDTQWKFENKRILIDDLFTKSYKTIEDYVDEENGKLDEKTMKNVERIEINWINKDTEICKSIELEVLNGTNACGL